MNQLERAYLQFLHDRPGHWWGRAVFSVLKLLSFFYLTGWWARKTAYRSGLVRRKHLDCPVISVGNITTGGTGKTPVVISLARTFTACGKKVAVLSRGYGRPSRASSLVWVSDGRKLLAGPEQGGDEPVLIARSVPKAAVIVCADRYRAGLDAVREFKPDLIILDDGFQRRFALYRDLDILVVDGINPFSTGWVLPAGLLREPLGALAEANVILLNKVNQARSPEDIRTVLKRHNPRAYLVESRYRPVALREFHTGKKVKPSKLEGVPVGAFSGLASHLYFIRTLEHFNVIVRHAYDLKDHFAYTKEKLRAILEDAKFRGLRYLVTTQKDEVKLPRDMEPEVPILVLDIELEVTEGKNLWQKVLKTMLVASTRA
jgi:tetraacyldisaccharide 4'-kinase